MYPETPTAVGESNDYPSLKIMNRKQLAERPMKKWLIDQWLPEGSLACMYGPPSSGKTFMALDMGMSIQNNLMWHGHEVMPGKVVFMAGEGVDGLKSRIAAWEIAHGFSSLDAEFHVTGDVVNLLHHHTSDRLLSSFKESGEPGLVIFDTLNRYMVGGNENEASSMSDVFRTLREIIDETGTSILLIHHTGKDGRTERGSNSLRATCDVMLAVKKKLVLKVDKQRDAAVTSPIHFEMEEHGDSLVPVSTGQQSTPNISHGQLNILNQLKSSVLTNGMTNKELRDNYPMGERQYYRDRKTLDKKQFIVERGSFSPQRWVLTKESVAFLNAIKDKSG